MSVVSIKRALLSVSDKTGLVEFARTLVAHGVELISTGGTAAALRKAKVPVTDVSQVTNFPEMMDGRVKTLHPALYGGILARRDLPNHMAALNEHHLQEIDLVVVNLYPFEQTISKEETTEEQAIEQIDIGGPSLLRAAAKNFASVTAVTNVSDYALVLAELEKFGGTQLETRRSLALKVFSATAHYDRVISDYLKRKNDTVELLDLHYEKVLSLRYGENPHQKAAFFRDPDNRFPNVTNAKVLHGKQLSYNNIIDTDAAIELVKEFEAPAAVLIKHTNPCGVAEAQDIDQAFMAAHKTDAMAAFGCVIALNRPCTLKIVQYIQKVKLFVEIIACPSFEPAALKELQKKPNLRLLETGELIVNPEERHIRSVAGGLLIQHADRSRVLPENCKTVTKKKPTDAQLKALLFAAQIVKHVKSNAVVCAKEENGVLVTTGIGAGQMSRVDSVWIAAHKGGKNIKGSVMASDAFFPFPDAMEEAAKAGVEAFIQPGGSIRDAEVIARADALGVVMCLSGIRSFKH